MASKTVPSPASAAYPRQYWWVVLIALPIILALVQYQPWKRAGGSSGTNVSGNQFLGPAVVGNVSLVINEAAKAGATLDPALIEALRNAGTSAKQGDHDAAVAAIEQVRATSGTLAKLPSLMNNLGIEYLATGRTDEARKSFEEVLRQDPGNKPAWAGLAQLPDSALTPVTLVNFTSQVPFREASNLVDDNPSSVWTSYDGTFPQSFIVQLPVESTIAELSFNTPNEDSAPKDIDIAVSTTSATSGFDAAIKAALVKGDIGESVRLSPPRVGRWIKLRILSNHGDPKSTSLAHLVVIGKPHVE